MCSRVIKSLLALFIATGLFAAGVSAAAAAPGDPLPTAPLGDVHPGDTCQARTVLHGTTISSFDVEIIEVVDNSGLAFGDLIYFKVVDPDVAAIGVAQGMSGSPILCEIGGVDKVVGAISYGFSGVGPKAFATPIGDVLNGQPAPAQFSAQARNTPTYQGRELVELRAPLNVSGVPPASRNTFRKYLEKQGYDSISFAGPASVDVPATSPDLEPGGAFSVNYIHGDVTIGAICTITYRDGNDFWGCGHPIDLAGQRSLSISGAYIFDVLGQPWSETAPFKFGAATRTQVGSLLYDGPFAVSGKLGVQAPFVPVKLSLKAEGNTFALESRVSDESRLPGGPAIPFLSPGLAAMIMSDQAQFSRAGQPTIQRGRICIRQSVIGASAKVNACNRFASGGASVLREFIVTGATSPVAFQIGGLEGLLMGATYKSLYPGALEVDIEIRTGSALRQIVGVRPLGRLRLGQQARFQVISADRYGKRYRQTLKLKVPRKVKTKPSKLIPAMPIATSRNRKSRIQVMSSAFYSGSLGEGSYLATDNDGDVFFGLGFDSIRNAKELGKAIHLIYKRKAKLMLSVPWARKPIAFPLRSGNDLLVGYASTSAKVLPAKRIR